MRLTIPTKFPATIELPEGFALEFKQSASGDVYLTFCDGMGGIGYEDGCDAATAFLSWLGCTDYSAELPASVTLALRDLSHQAVDMVCERLSSEPLISAVFAGEVAP